MQDHRRFGIVGPNPGDNEHLITALNLDGLGQQFFQGGLVRPDDQATVLLQARQPGGRLFLASRRTCGSQTAGPHTAASQTHGAQTATNQSPVAQTSRSPTAASPNGRTFLIDNRAGRSFLLGGFFGQSRMVLRHDHGPKTGQFFRPDLVAFQPIVPLDHDGEGDISSARRMQIGSILARP